MNTEPTDLDKLPVAERLFWTTLMVVITTSIGWLIIQDLGLMAQILP